MSKQAASKRRALEEIRNGTFIRNPKRWENFKSKLAQLDPLSEVSETDPTLARSAKHSRCGAWILMAAPYDVERFKAHVKSCSYSTGAGGMKTLENFGVRVLVRAVGAQPSSSPIPSAPHPPRVALPCLGLTEKEDKRIKQYLMRTSVNSAGGKSIQDVATELFSDQYKNLSQEQKDIVRQKQAQTHIWSVDRMRKSIHAIGKNACNGNARQGRDGTLKPCDQCQGLLSLRAFLNAINRRAPEDKNRAYVPHAFQSAEVGKIYSMGLNSLINGVRAMNII
jgi:hypothetical protein